MGRELSIITVGLSPAWDITCRGRNLDWGLHQCIDGQTIQPAGKALNVSKALAWMGQRNIAAGLWGREDYKQMLAAVRLFWPLTGVKMTAVAGRTRTNVTVVDTANDRDMHLRAKSSLASKETLSRLNADLQALVTKSSVCVFAGAMPEDKLLDDVIRLVKTCRRCGAKVVLDTSGVTLRRAVDTGDIWLMKPNVQELRQLVGHEVADRPAALVKVGKTLLDKVEVILISRGQKGAVLVTKKGAWTARASGASCGGRRKGLSTTVGCGDYLLAGFLKALKDKSDPGSALVTALKVATARAWGWTEEGPWAQAKSRITVEPARVE
jgi:1-phosphofructokinase